MSGVEWLLFLARCQRCILFDMRLHETGWHIESCSCNRKDNAPGVTLDATLDSHSRESVETGNVIPITNGPGMFLCSPDTRISKE